MRRFLVGQRLLPAAGNSPIVTARAAGLFSHVLQRVHRLAGLHQAIRRRSGGFAPLAFAAHALG